MRSLYLLLAMSLICMVSEGQTSYNSIPNCKLEPLSGPKVSFQSFFKDGKTLVIIYSWGCCWGPPCQKSLDSLEVYYRNWEEKYGIKIISVNRKAGREWEECTETIKKSGRWSFPFYWDLENVLCESFFSQAAVDCTKCPYLIIVDDKNKTISATMDVLPAFGKNVEDELLKLKKEN